MLERGEVSRILTRLSESIYDLLSISKNGVSDDWLEEFRNGFMDVEGGTLLRGDNHLHGKLHAFKEEVVLVKSFSIGKTVITQSQWKTVMDPTACLGRDRNI